MIRTFDRALDAFLWLTECNLATLEELKDLKSSSKLRIQRQQEICDTAMAYVRRLAKTDSQKTAKEAYANGCIRIHDLLKEV